MQKLRVWNVIPSLSAVAIRILKLLFQKGTCNNWQVREKGKQSHAEGTSTAAARHVRSVSKTGSSHHKLPVEIGHQAVTKGSMYLLMEEAVAYWIAAKGSVYLLKGEAVAHDGPGMGGAAVLGDGFLG